MNRAATLAKRASFRAGALLCGLVLFCHLGFVAICHWGAQQGLTLASPGSGAVGDALPSASPQLLFAIAALGLLTLALVVPLTRQLTRPLHKLAAMAAELSEEGQLSRPTVKPPNDMGLVTGALDSLASNVQQVLAEKEAMLATVSHELRSPLARMAVLVELLEMARESPEEHASTLREVEREIDSLREVVEILLTTSRNQANPKPLAATSLDVNDWVTRACRAAELDARQRGVTMQTQLDPAVQVMTGEPNLLDRALSNLVTNAVRHARSTVQVTSHWVAPRIEITVDDDGKGIAPEMRELIFAPFEKSMSGGGAGLGLMLARGIAERHGGTLRADDSPLGGARFCLSIPIDEGPHI